MNHKHIVALLLVSFLANFVLLGKEQAFHEPDSSGYLGMADIMTEKGLISGEPFFDTVLTPGYP